jgi:hypothetical protein
LRTFAHQLRSLNRKSDAGVPSFATSFAEKATAVYKKAIAGKKGIKMKKARFAVNNFFRGL